MREGFCYSGGPQTVVYKRTLAAKGSCTDTASDFFDFGTRIQGMFEEAHESPRTRSRHFSGGMRASLNNLEHMFGHEARKNALFCICPACAASFCCLCSFVCNCSERSTRLESLPQLPSNHNPVPKLPKFAPWPVNQTGQGARGGLGCCQLPAIHVCASLTFFASNVKIF